MLRGAQTRGLVVLTATISLGASSARADVYPNPIPTTQVGGGAVVAADPSLLIRSGAPRYVLFSTANNQERYSTDRVTWTVATSAQPATPLWWTTDTQGWQTWAPDVSFHKNKYWMYYARSQGFGSQNVRVGLATSTPPQGNAGAGTWIDQGEVLRSQTGDNFRALDPNLVEDDNGKLYLTWGSFYDGIFLQEVDPNTGKPLYYAQRIKIAQRVPADPADPPDARSRSIEAPFIFKHGGYYYLFVSFGLCCQEPFDYDIRVGRSTSVTGPYKGPLGTDMRDGGGAKILAGHPGILAPGGQSVVHDPITNEDLLVYHYVTKKVPLARALAINRLGWDADGWPYVK
jgi:arabinan endo-1,5-alpha-L-arabinosidase